MVVQGRRIMGGDVVSIVRATTVCHGIIGVRGRKGRNRQKEKDSGCGGH